MTLSVLQLLDDPPDPRALGGIQVHVAALAEGAPAGVSVHTAHPLGGLLRVEGWGPRRLVARLPISGPGTNREPRMLESAIVAAILGTKAGVVHVHSPLLGARTLASAARRTSARVAITLHDHALVCENYDLLEGGERFCGIPADLSRCDRCLARTRHLPPGAILRHREAMRDLVSVTDAFVAPSDSVLELVRRVHPEVGDRAHRVDWGVPQPAAARRWTPGPSGPLSVAVVGVLSHEKGRGRLPELLAACNALPITWHLFGATEGASVADLRRSAPRVVVHGAYPRLALAERLARANCRVALVPSIKPESFSLVLSEVMAAGLPVIVSDLGALPERVVRQGFGWSFDPFAPATLAALLGELSAERSRVDAAAARVRATPSRTERAMVDDHVALWRALGATPRASGGPQREEARAAWTRGTRDAAREQARLFSRLASVVGALRHSDFYRDLPLRRALPESTRKTVEGAVSRFLGRLGRQ